MLDVPGLLVQLLSGFVGAHLVVRLIGGLDLGRLGNLVAGLIGGAIGGQMIATVLDAGARVPMPVTDATTLVSQIGAGGVGGGLALTLVALVRRLGSGT